MRRRRRLKQSAAAIALYLQSAALTIFTDAQGDKNKDQGRDQLLLQSALSPSAAALTDSLVAPQPVVNTGGLKNVTPLPTMFGTFVATSIGASSSTAVTGGGSTFTQPPTETFVTMQLSDKTCPGSLDKRIVIDSRAVLYYHLEPSDSGKNNGILCGRLEADSNNGGWIGFGWSSNGSMIGGEAIVGLTDARSVLKYNLNSKMASGVVPMSVARQTLTDTSIRLVGGRTIMTFTKMLREDGELELYETGPNAFLHARGSNGQTVGYHDNGRFVFVKDFMDDITNPPSPPPTRIQTPRPTMRSTLSANIFTQNPTEIYTRIPLPDLTPLPTNGFIRPTVPNQTTPRPVFSRPTSVQNAIPTMRPAPVGPGNCLTITKDECKASIYCEWVLISGQKNYCTFGPPVPPTLRPSLPPTIRPTFDPTDEPTRKPTLKPTLDPTPLPTVKPTPYPTLTPTKRPTRIPSAEPSIITYKPSTSPTIRPTFYPTKSPSQKPSIAATQSPSVKPSGKPSSSPTMSSEPSSVPSSFPTTSTSPSYSPTSTQLPTYPDYERPKRVDLRWTHWDDLGRDIQIEVSEALGYDKRSWENLKTNDVEKLRWSDLSERKRTAAAMLGFDKWSWNCWMNNFESFSWNQLHDWELTSYLESLGWDSQSWNLQNGEVNKPQSWDELTSEQQESAMHLCFYKASYDELNIVEYGFGYPIARPSARFVPWTDLEPEMQATMTQTLGYTAFTWNIPGLNPVELKGWFEMTESERRAADAINCTDSCWDCWQAHYNSYGWQDLVNKGHDKAYSALGWDQTSWCGDSEAPASNKRSWDDLSEQEQLNATELCLNKFNWDQNSLEVNTGPFPFIQPSQRYVEWDSLTSNQQQIAAALLYTEESWNQIGTADIELRSFDDLTDLQKSHAIQLGFYEKTWDCFQNHYRAVTWRDLPSNVRSACEMLGWDQSNWGITKPLPDIYDKRWDALTTAERIAATTLCHFDNNWPGDTKGKHFGSFLQEGIKSHAPRMLPRVGIAATIFTYALMSTFV